MASSNIDFTGGNLKRLALKQMGAVATVTLKNSISGAPMSNLIKGYEDFLNAYAGQVRNSRRTFNDAHNRAANNAREAILSAYDARVKQDNSYRANSSDVKLKRFSNGALRRVLEAPDFFTVSYDGVQMGNVGRLNSEAPQWARLNFGTGGGSEGSNASAGISSGYASNFTTYFQRAASDMVEKPGARPAFSIPRGFWFDSGNNNISPREAGGGGDKFYPYRASIAANIRAGASFNPDDPSSRFDGSGNTPLLIQGQVQTRGIKARRFLDEGIFKLFSSLAGEYGVIVARWREAAEASRPKGPLV